MHIKPRAIATVLCMIFFIGFAVCGVVRSTDKETSEIKQSYPVLAEADTLCPDKVLVMYDGGGDDFTAIQNETTFDYKKLGAQMMTDGFDLKASMDELNTKWADARAKLGIQ